jgi:large subunit ribosomal protein L19e
MNLKTRKELAARTLEIGKSRIVFLVSRIKDIKEAITKQDIRDLISDGAIVIKPVKGRKKVEKRKNKRSYGKIKKKVNKRKERYVIMTRKLRKYVANMKEQGKLEREEILKIRKKIRNKDYKDLAHLKEYIGELKK